MACKCENLRQKNDVSTHHEGPHKAFSEKNVGCSRR